MNTSEKVSPPSKPDISEEMVSRWQTIANLMAMIVGVPAGLIMKVELGCEPWRSPCNHNNTSIIILTPIGAEYQGGWPFLPENAPFSTKQNVL